MGARSAASSPSMTAQASLVRPMRGAASVRGEKNRVMRAGASANASTNQDLRSRGAGSASILSDEASRSRAAGDRRMDRGSVASGASVRGRGASDQAALGAAASGPAPLSEGDVASVSEDVRDGGAALTDNGDRGRRAEAPGLGADAAGDGGSGASAGVGDANTGLDRRFGAPSGRRHTSDGRSRSAAREGTAASRRGVGRARAPSRCASGARSITSAGGEASGRSGVHAAGSLFRDVGTSPVSASWDVRWAT